MLVSLWVVFCGIFNAILKVVFWCPSEEGFSFLFFYILFYVKTDFRGLGNDILYAKIDFRELGNTFLCNKTHFPGCQSGFFFKTAFFFQKVITIA